MKRSRHSTEHLLLWMGLMALMNCFGGTGCGGGDHCGAGNCAGCCVDGICVAGTEAGECGQGGQECQVCIAGLDCIEGACVPSSTSCGPGNCADGCCDQGVCRSGGDSFACGTGGEDCQVCQEGTSCISGACQEVGSLCAASCSGCCLGNQCMAGNSPEACGRSGAACRTCGTSEFCNQEGQCQCSPSCNGKWCGDDDGCGGRCSDTPCQQAGFLCQQGQCEVDPQQTWTVFAQSASISSIGPDGSTWDVAGGPPDPFLCLTFGSSRKCTNTLQDTLQPVWRQRLHSVPSMSLMSGFVLELVDEDLSSNDLICSRNSLQAQRQDFLDGRLTVECNYATIEIDLVPPIQSSASCIATANNVYDGCLKFRNTLCDRLVSCHTFADMVECGTWFDSEDGFGGCDPEYVDPILDPAKFQDCICGMGESSCQDIASGILTAMPACGEWV